MKLTQVGKNPVRTGLLITVNTVYFHCGKAMIRSKLWDESSKIGDGEFPSFGEIIKEEVRLEQSKEEMDAHLEDAYENSLY